MLRRKFMADVRKRAKVLKGAINKYMVTDDTLALKPAVDPLKFNAFREYQFRTNPEKLNGFKAWFQGQVDRGVLEVGKQPPWTNTYVDSAYRKGVVRAYTDTHREALAASSDFYAGSQAQFLQQAFASPEVVSKIQMIYTRTYDSLKGYTAQMATDTSRILAQGLSNGYGPRQIAREMNARIDGLTRKRALTIARTEVINAHAEGQLDAFELMGVEEVGLQAEWSTAGDDRVCARCAAMAGEVMSVKKARGLIPLHPNCVVGSTQIISPNPLSIFCGHYTGKIVEIVTAKGRRLSVTENHVLLSERGWVPAKFLAEGDYLFDAAAIKSCVFQDPDNDHGVACIEDVFTTLFESLGEGCKTSTDAAAEDFHGDGKSFNSKIDIILSNRHLREQTQTAFFSKPEEFDFMFGDIPSIDTEAFDSRGAFSEHLFTVAAAADCFMGFNSVLSVFLRGTFFHHQPIGGDLPAALDAGHIQSVLHNIPTDAKLLTELVDRNPGLIKLDEIIQRFRTEFDSGFGSGLTARSDQSNFFEVFPKCVPSTNPLGSVGTTHSREVALDCIVEINTAWHNDLLVYDVETAESMYIANGLLSSNCRCAWIPSSAPSAKKIFTSPALTG